MMKKLLLCSFLMLGFMAIGQNLNGYRYVSLPRKFDFLKEDDKYNANTMAKIFLQQYGFETYFADDKAAPQDFLLNKCNKLYAVVEKEDSMIYTKLKLLLKDCNDRVVFTSKQGKTNSKDYRTAYREALREAMSSLAVLNYKYDPSVSVIKTKPIEPAAQTNTTSVKETAATTVEMLYAQPIPNGFQLIDSEPKVVYKIYKTANSDIFAAVKGDISGNFVPKGNDWFFEYYVGEKLVSEKVNVKF